jgi:hypothetical protein
MQFCPAQDTRAKVYVRAAGGVGAGGVDLHAYASGEAASLRADATPEPLRAMAGVAAPRMSRMASRFAQLAVLGASSCLRRLGGPPSPGTRVYLGTGLGDVAATDALYYCVMPPRSEAPPPARFATSGNNMAAFFVSQYAQLNSRNLTVSHAELSFECALDLALSDLSTGATEAALVGGVDETTLPREFYTRRFPVASDQVIGEGSAWLLLEPAGAAADPAPDALGAITGVRLLPSPSSPGAASWAAQVMDTLDALGPAHAYSGHNGLCPTGVILTAGCGTGVEEIAALAARLPACQQYCYLPYSGRFPTASALGVVSLFALQWPSARTNLHVNRDASGRTGLVMIEVYGGS